MKNKNRRMFKLPPLKNMIKISEDKLFSSKMLSKEGWKQLNEVVPRRKYRHADCEKLADGLVEFIEIWLDNNDYFIDFYNFDIKQLKSGTVFIYYDDVIDKYRYYRGNLEDDLTTRFSEYLLGD